MIYQYTPAGKLLNTFENYNEAVKQFAGTGRKPSVTKSNICRSIRIVNQTAYGFKWKADKEKKEKKKYIPKRTITDKFVDTEMRDYSATVTKFTKKYETYCFTEEQAEKLIDRIKKRKLNWDEIDYYPVSLDPLIFKVEMRR